MRIGTPLKSEPRDFGNEGRNTPPVFALFVATLALSAGLALSATDSNHVAGPSQFELTHPNKATAPGEAPEGMVWIPGGEFSMGSEGPAACGGGGSDPMSDARPIHRVF
ncbi:MAG TPA: hypothetical protein VM735_08410, partial [Candidatus Kapabacteria bacterium]|nr:hypothetical protein [Candidatus Kapabacteria bacterium]